MKMGLSPTPPQDRAKATRQDGTFRRLFVLGGAGLRGAPPGPRPSPISLALRVRSKEKGQQKRD
jgi:hypothetical protein